jgi:hypothetical protein
MDNYEAIQVCPRHPPYSQIWTRLNHAEQALHKSLPPFSPYVPASLLPSIALILLASTFALAFYFST